MNCNFGAKCRFHWTENQEMTLTRALLKFICQNDNLLCLDIYYFFEKYRNAARRNKWKFRFCSVLNVSVKQSCLFDKQYFSIWWSCCTTSYWTQSLETHWEIFKDRSVKIYAFQWTGNAFDKNKYISSNILRLTRFSWSLLWSVPC